MQPDGYSCASVLRNCALNFELNLLQFVLSLSTKSARSSVPCPCDAYFFNRYSPAAYYTSKLIIDVLLLRVIPACFYAGMVHLLVQVGPLRLFAGWFCLARTRRVDIYRMNVLMDYLFVMVVVWCGKCSCALTSAAACGS